VIVVDTNIVAALCFPSPLSETAEALWREDPRWRAPPLVRSELRSVAAKYVAAGLADEETAAHTLRNARRLVAVDPELDLNDGEVLALAAKTSCSTYDCEFVWLARTQNVPLLTWDRRVLHAFPKVAVAPGAFLG